MTKSAKGVLIALLFALLTSVQAFQGPPAIGLFDGIEFPNSPYAGDFISSRIFTFNVKKGSGNLRSSGIYTTQVTTNELIPIKSKAEIRNLSSLEWDFQVPYTVLTTPRAGDYTMKMTAPLGGSFSNVLYATTNVPAVPTGTQAGTFYMTEKRLDMSQDYFSDILWQRDDGHLGMWFMGKTVNKAVVDTNLNVGIYLDSLYEATGHKQFDLDWRIVCQTDWDLNGMQDIVWQNTNSGKLRVWELANTDFVDPALGGDYNYHHYSEPIVSTTVNPNDYTITTNYSPTLITNIFTVTTTTINSNVVSGPNIIVNTVYGTNVTSTNIVINLTTTNTFTTTVENITSVTNSTGVVYLTNTVSISTNTITTNSFENFTLTNVTVTRVSGRNVSITNILFTPNLLEFTGADIVVPNVGGSGIDLTNTYTYINDKTFVTYFTNIFVTTYADVIPGYLLVTYTTNYNISSSTNFFNPFVREVSLDDQSPYDASFRLIGSADFDNDGQPDFLFRASDGSIFYEAFYESFEEAYANEYRYISPKGNTALENWTIAGILDLNNDGWPDLLLQSTKTGATAIWFMQGKFDENSNYLYKRFKYGSLNGGAAIPSWKICANADFNHDGQMDVLLRNTRTGQLIFWYLNGPRLVKTSILDGPVVPWEIVGPK